MPLSEDLNAIPRLFGEAVEQLGKLVQNETRLALTEVSQKISQASIGAAYVIGAAVLCIPVLVVLLIALALGLTEMGLRPVTAHLLAAVVGAIISGALALVGMSYLKPDNLKAKVTIRQVERDVAMAKELTR